MAIGKKQCRLMMYGTTVTASIHPIRSAPCAFTSHSTVIFVIAISITQNVKSDILSWNKCDVLQIYHCKNVKNGAYSIHIDGGGCIETLCNAGID